MWPTFENFKLELENWLNQHHPDYLREVGYREWTNAFSGCHHSMVIIINNRNHNCCI